jgi:hypothetical protein
MQGELAVDSVPVGSIVEVTWRDSAQHMLEWATVKEAVGFPLATVYSVGYLLLVDDEKIVLASDKDGDDDVKNFTIIPRGCVLMLSALGVAG